MSLIWRVRQEKMMMRGEIRERDQRGDVSWGSGWGAGWGWRKVRSWIYGKLSHSYICIILRRKMRHHLKLALLSCLFWSGSSKEILVYWAAHSGQRYGNVSLEFQGTDIGHCSLQCAKSGSPRTFHAFNFRITDGSCQLIRDSSHLVPSDGYQSWVQCK